MKNTTLFKMSAISALLVSNLSHAIVISTTTNASDLTDKLIIPNSGLTVTSSSLTGATGQAGVYTNLDGVYGLPTEGGIAFSSGDVADYAAGPNSYASNSTNFGNPASTSQNAILSEITGQSIHFDPVELNITFDVDNNVNTVSFIGAFGSEEYPEFVNSSFIDGFVLLLNDENVAGAQPTGAQPGDPLLPLQINHPDFTSVSGTELDGLIAPNGSPLLRFDIPVEPGSTGNTFTMLLADASDDSLDTTVYLSSFGNFDSNNGESEFTPLMPDPSNPTNDEGGFVFELPEVEANEIVWIDPDVSTGYVYDATGGGLFASVTAPTLASVNDPDGYILSYLNQSGIEVFETLLAGQTYSFPDPVGTFTISGIDESLMLDPTDPLAFVTGLSFSAAGQFGVTQSPITVFVDDGTTAAVPEPSTLSILALSLFGLHRRIRKSKN